MRKRNAGIILYDRVSEDAGPLFRHREPKKAHGDIKAGVIPSGYGSKVSFTAKSSL